MMSISIAEEFLKGVDVQVCSGYPASHDATKGDVQDQTEDEIANQVWGIK